MLTKKRTITKLFALLAASIILAVFLNQPVAFAAVATDAAKAVAVLIKSLSQSKNLLQEHQILLRQIGAKVDDFLPHLSTYQKEYRIIVLLEAAEQKGLIKPTEKLRWHHDILNGKVQEDDLIKIIRSSPSSAAVNKGGNMPNLLKIESEYLPLEALQILKLIDEGGPFPYIKDGAVFYNREGKLPIKTPDYYREYTVQSPGADDRGAKRIITGEDGVKYFTDDHYQSFKEIKP
jgi:ribonuclease T1